MTTLADLKNGADARVAAVTGEPRLRERLAELGFTPGAGVAVRNRAPFGGPIEVRVRGGLLAVRVDEAACVELAAGSASA